MRYPKLISQGMEAMLSWPKTGGIIGIPVLRPPGTNDRPTRVVLTRFCTMKLHALFGVRQVDL
jgi:hypothetical protein